jgi:phosphonate transport system ATP-binding protein
MVELKNISVRRGEREILSGISTEIRPGTVTAIVGRSGVGKTTLLSVLNGLQHPCSGQILVGDSGPSKGENLGQSLPRTATVFQNHALIDRLSALDNVLLGLADSRHPLSILPWSREIKIRAAASLEQVGLLDRARSRVDRLSGGERQRVGLARALVREPRLLLGDEPFSSVDPIIGRQLGGMVRDLATLCGMTVVLVLHQLEMAFAFADRIIGLVDGRLAYDGAALEFDGKSRALVFPSSP